MPKHAILKDLFLCFTSLFLQLISHLKFAGACGFFLLFPSTEVKFRLILLAGLQKYIYNYPNLLWMFSSSYSNGTALSFQAEEEKEGNFFFFS